MKRTTLNRNPSIKVMGKIDVPPSSVIILDGKDRADLVQGKPMIINGRRYVVTGRVPPEPGEDGAKVYLVLGLDKSTRKERRKIRK